MSYINLKIRKGLLKAYRVQQHFMKVRARQQRQRKKGPKESQMWWYRKLLIIKWFDKFRNNAILKRQGETNFTETYY